MTDRTKSILAGAAVVAAAYVAMEWFAKPAMQRMAGVNIR